MCGNVEEFSPHLTLRFKRLIDPLSGVAKNDRFMPHSCRDGIDCVKCFRYRDRYNGSENKVFRDRLLPATERLKNRFPLIYLHLHLAQSYAMNRLKTDPHNELLVGQ